MKYIRSKVKAEEIVVHLVRSLFQGTSKRTVPEHQTVRLLRVAPIQVRNASVQMSSMIQLQHARGGDDVCLLEASLKR